MIVRQGSTYHHRRRVPDYAVPVLGKRELWFSLSTHSRAVARARAGALLGSVDRVFGAVQAVIVRDEPPSSEEVERLRAEVEAIRAELEVTRRRSGFMARVINQQALQRSYDGELQDELHEAMRDATRLEGALETTEKRAAEKAAELDKANQEAGAAQQIIARVTAALGAQSQDAPKSAKPTLLSETEPFLTYKKEYKEQARAQTRVSIRLLAEVCGDRPVDTYTGKDAVVLQRELRRLPASHGKARGETPPAPKAIALADEKAKNGSAVARLSEKTIKRHFSALQQMWKYFLINEHVSRNIFGGHQFPGAKSSKTKRDDWSPEDINRIAVARWTSKQVDEMTARWVIGLAAYSGMRLEEIARLRPQDVETHEGIPILNIQEHPDGWSPKSEAGARAVPLHPVVLEAGFLELAEERRRAGALRLFPTLRPGGLDRRLGFDLSREFGKFKTKNGVGAKTTFHSWRHSVTTILRNTDPALVRGDWIDAILGHEGGQKSEGAKTYLKRIGAANLRRTVEAIAYPADANPARLLPKVPLQHC